MKLNTNRNSNYKQGFFHPANPEKMMRNDIPFYRSGIELEFMRWCDNNHNIIKWDFEPFSICYYDPMKKKNRQYFVDNYVEIREGNKIKKYHLELKSERETKKPESKAKKKKATLLVEQCTWVTNNAKWKYAIKFCEKNDMEFLLLGYNKKDGFIPVNLDFLV
jgi:hypothetical protein